MPMFNDPSSIEEAVQKLNAVSPSFCMAKWMHSTIHLNLGRTHSCHLPHHHVIPLKEIKKNPSALHNTSYKKDLRKMMLKGKRPSECQTCWDIEDLPEKRYSDRHFRGQDSWIKPFYEEVTSSKWDKDINPSYLEVSFSSTCNFKCSYCGPTYSTAWIQEIEEKGGYKLSNFTDHQSLFWLKAQGLMPITDEVNPYVDAFWKWWPTLKKQLMFFRLTGGEPLLIPDTFKLLSLIDEEPLPHLELSVNSNLGVPEKQFDKFMTLTKSIVENKKVKHFMMHTSLDTYGSHAEYIRHGLDFKRFEGYVERYLTELPTSSISFTCTFNALSVVGFIPFLEWVISLRKRFASVGRQIYIDLPHLKYPMFMSCAALTPDYQEHMKKIIAFMEEREDNRFGIKPAETLKMRRILDWMESKQPQNKKDEQELYKHQRDFYSFFSEHDKRRGTDFLKTFPEMKDFYEHCRKLAD
ncbi:hypothetical protein DOM21_01325 [Bacteriovorax stolpii]|nr:hypothetical protein DOM21_01325 [Bacteriovorax stolpii]TDP54220.1 hypothetical protein C8D79_1513 [Bacteriovorax stolpii]